MGARLSWWYDAGRVAAGVGVVPLAVSPPDDERFAGGVLLRVVFDFIAEECGDFSEVEVGEKHGDHDLRCRESSDSAAVGGFDVFAAAAFDLGVQGFDGVTGVLVELVPFFAAVVEGLGLSAEGGGGEGDRVLLTDFVGEVGQVCTINGRAFLVDDFCFQELS